MPALPLTVPNLGLGTSPGIPSIPQFDNPMQNVEAFIGSPQQGIAPVGFSNEFGTGTLGPGGSQTAFMEQAPIQLTPQEQQRQSVLDQYNMQPQAKGELQKAYDQRMTEGRRNMYGGMLFERQKANILDALGGTLGSTWEDLTGRFGGQQQMFDMFGTGLNEYGSIGTMAQNPGGRTMAQGGTQMPRLMRDFMDAIQGRDRAASDLNQRRTRMPRKYRDWFDDLDRGRFNNPFRFQRGLQNK